MKTILDKINKAYEFEANKTELAKHEVELALIDEFNNEASIVTKAVDAGNTLVKQASQTLKDAATKYQQAIGNNSKAIQLGQKIINDAKELGITPPNTLIGTIKMLETRLKDLQAAADRINKQANGTYGITK